MKKVLIITYYWPPAGGPGVQRWLKFAKYLPEYQIEPILYVPENPDYPILDPSLKKEIPEDITVLKRKIFEPYFLAKFFSKKQVSTISSGIIAAEEKQNFLQRFLLYIRGNFFIPDARKFWIKPSVKYLQKYISDNNIGVIITTGPPHSLHLIGSRLKEKTGCKWIADFRDPWTQIGYHKKLKLSTASRREHLRLELKVLQEADHILTTSFTTREEFSKKTSQPVSVITNGYEEYDLPPISPANKFIIAHIGSLLSGRNPRNLWQVLGELISEDIEFANEFRLELTGAVSEEVLTAIRTHGIHYHLIHRGYVSHTEALKLQRNARVLLLVEINSPETRAIIPGKLFEYLSARRPILGIGPEKWDVEKILEETSAGKVIGYEDVNQLKKQIRRYFKDYQQETLQVNSSDITNYSRRKLTGDLAKLIKEI